MRRKNSNRSSIVTNAVLNSLKVIFSLVFSLITYSYMLRVLQVENVGKINFYVTLVSYFQLIAALGIQTYATCEGSARREEKRRINRFAGQMYSINIIASFLVYILLAFLVISISSFRENWLLIVILSSSIFFNAVGVDWIFSAYEDYLYITVRYVLTQIVTIILLFLFVKNENDYLLYALVITIPMAILNIVNRFYAKKYCCVKFTVSIDIKTYIWPLMTIFVANAATVIYCSSDITMLGVINGDRSVGLYSLPAKIYSMMKNILGAAIVVAIPKIKLHLENNRYLQHKALISELFCAVLILSVPVSIGIFCLSDEIILIIGGKDFIEAGCTLRVLAVSMVFAVLNGLTTTAVLIPMKKEKLVMICTMIAAAFNIILNIILLPQFQQEGAAVTTLIAEVIIFSITILYCRKSLDFQFIFRNSSIVILMIPFTIISSLIVKMIVQNILARILCLFMICAVFYLTVLAAGKNNFFRTIVDLLKKKGQCTK